MAMLLVLERQKLGLSQAALARATGANPSSISRIESGKEPPYPLRAQRIADALRWEGDPMDLFEEVEDREDGAV
ncbi:MAG: helix-turn-helix domain-containing protein [Adlercreutzia equolifaciens]